ncbi:glycoside hydrolase family 127 protein [Seonamhaeicola maritimus]|uniref:Glycoside hydrolase family 127 protein n=1 Tax=Seonamhaeicola maritimus TaxID=2591822 RepID=A0A5C7GE72_9FLAO|nr:glycoside hydrolase family 127 protein [Seonamhaeicola maritimus]TXG34681.1 glycoside hydrolase family 127 protein [Seonamhaeicola maritimus]
MKKIVITSALVFVMGTSFAQKLGVINNAESPNMKLKTVDFDDCVWTDGFWAEKQKLCHETMLPNLGKLMEDPNTIHAFNNFKVAAGLVDGEFRGFSFHDGDFYKYIEALSYAYGLTKDESINTKMDEYIAVIAKGQRDNGYIHTKIQIGHGKNKFPRQDQVAFDSFNDPFTIDFDHEFYNFGHLMSAACVHHRITGKKNFLNIAIKASDHIYDKFHKPSPELAAIDWNPPHYMGLVEMYRTTGNRKYLELAQTFIDMLGSTEVTGAWKSRGLDHSQKRTPFRKETEAVGHAGHGNYLYCGATDLYAETGEQALFDALEKIWNNLVNQKMFITGATGSYHHTVSRNNDKISEGYAEIYDLPNTVSYNETCANIGNGMFNWRMFLLNGESRFADTMELIFYNSALSGIDLEGKNYYYTNPLRYVQGQPQKTRDFGKRREFMPVFCCPPNIIRTIAKMHSYAYSKSEDAIWMNLYGSNTLDTDLANGTNVKLTQKSNYPWDGQIQIAIDVKRKKEFSLKLRIPAWVEGASLKVNGEPITEVLTPGTYFDLKRTWKKGDVLELNLPMEAQLIEANPHVEQARNQVAVKYGPLVYCLESKDLPEGTKVQDVVIPQNIKLSPRYDANLLSGVTVLEGEAEVLNNKTWSNQSLYKKLEPKKIDKVDITLIPYYTWSNRGPVDMSVWLPVVWK